MEYRYLGRTGVQVSPVGLGSDDFGDGTPPELAETLMLRSLDAGINLIDTGNLYAGGTSEAIIGKTLADSGRRHEVLISTKIDHAPRKVGGLPRRARPADAAERPGELAAQHHPRLRAFPEKR